MIVNAQPDMEVVGEAADGREAVELACALLPDLVVLDIPMPNLNGRQAAAQLSELAPAVKILTPTRHTDPAYRRELQEAGASGYALKQSGTRRLIEAIRLVAAGGSYLDPAMTENAPPTVAQRRIRLRGEISGQPLTTRETETLRLIALGYSNQELAVQWDISLKTVETHKSNAMKKMNLSGRREIIGYAMLRGWMQGD